jgi:apolipoprotein N-acyltransferase
MWKKSRSLLRLLACLLSGALMACATPPMNVYPMAWVGLVALSLMIEDDAGQADPPRRRSDGPSWTSLLSGGWRGFVFGFGTNLVALRFISPVVTRFASLPSFTGPVALVVLSAFEATRWMGAALVGKALSRLRVPPAIAFAIGVYSGTFVPTMIPWTVACGVCPWPATVQLAELVGERGVAMLMALQAALVAEGIRHSCHPLGRATDDAKAGGGSWRLSRLSPKCARPGVIAAALVAATLVYGKVRIHQIDALRVASPAAAIALIEPAVEAAMRWDEARRHEVLQRLTELTLRAEHDGADLVIWPEAAYPFQMNHVSRHYPSGPEAILQPGVRGPVLTGLVMTGDFGKYNSAVIATGDGRVSEPYDKMHLMWFGEMVPLADFFPWLRLAFARGAGLRAGERSVALESGRVRAAILNCLEDILPGAGREAMTTRPNLLVNITNDAWFEGSAESELHLRLARLRSVELRRDLVRAVNFGPTTWVDATGRLRARIPADKPGILMAAPALLEAPVTLYARLGDLPLALTSGAYALAVLIWSRRARAIVRCQSIMPRA